MSDDEERQSEGEEEESDGEAERAKQEQQRAAEEHRKQELAKRQQQSAKKKGSKKKGLSLTPEKKKLLKQLIMEKAAEEMRAEAKKRAEEKERHINANVPPMSLDGLDKSGLLKKVNELYKIMKDKEEDKYDWETKIRKQDLEINELNSKVNDIKGKFNKPVLKKVTKTERIAQKEKKQGIGDIRSTLKSTGQSKYQLDEQSQEPKTPDWRGTLKGKEGGEGGEGGEGEEGGEEVEAEA